MYSPHDVSYLADKLESKTQRAGECLIWTGKVDRRGRGVFMFHNHKVFAHRVAYAVARGGYIPANVSIKQTCGNKLCCRPMHLEKVRRTQ